MKKVLLTLLLVSNVALAETDNENPIIDISDTKKFPPAVTMPSDYKWSAIENDIKDYKEPPLRMLYSTGIKCKYGVSMLGGCLTREIIPVTKKYKSSLPKLSEKERTELAIRIKNNSVIWKHIAELKQLTKKPVNLKTNYHHI